MKIISPSFLDNQIIPSIYTCDGSNVSPPLQISDVSNNTRSLALIMEDPDSPGGTFIHWVLWNIDPNTHLIAEGLTPPEATRGINSFGNLNYDGPCPPSGVHRYHFVLYALDIKFDLEIGSTAENLTQALKNHIIDKADLVGLYGSNTS